MFSVACGGKGLPLPICVDCFLRRDPRERAQNCGICYNLKFTFHFILYNVMGQNMLQHPAKQYTQPCLTMSQPKCQHVMKRCISGQGGIVAPLSRVGYMYHAMICGRPLINHFRHYSPCGFPIFKCVTTYTQAHKHIKLRVDF